MLLSTYQIYGAIFGMLMGRKVVGKRKWEREIEEREREDDGQNDDQAKALYCDYCGISYIKLIIYLFSK